MKKLTKVTLITMCSALALNTTFAAEEEKVVATDSAQQQPVAQSGGWTLGGVLSCFNPFSWFGSASPKDQKVIKAALEGDEGAFGEAVVSHAMLQLSPEEQDAAMQEMHTSSISKKLEDAVTDFAKLPDEVRAKMIAAALDPEDTAALVAASKAIMETKGLDGVIVLDQLTSIIKAEKEKDEEALPALIPADEAGDLSEAVEKMTLQQEEFDEVTGSDTDELKPAANTTAEPADITAAKARIAELEAEKTKVGKLTQTKKGQLKALKKKVQTYEMAGK